MDIYEIINEAIQSKDLLYSGQKLIEFSDAAYKAKNRATLVKYFYQHLIEWGLLDYAFDDISWNSKKHYFICDELKAKGMFMALSLPSGKTPVKSLKDIRTFGERILAHYMKPGISRASLESILQYLDEEYSFLSKVFSKQKAAFILMPYSHKDYNSECLIVGAGENVVQHFFVYHMREKGETAPNPEAVIFHELGHAMHARCYGNIAQVPENILCVLQEICFPRIKQLSAADQCEVFADILSMGLMYQTPFEKYDLFQQIHPDIKAAFKLIVEKLLSRL
ncbi:MAG TPA: hypothetical protein DCY85_00610 [Firmicutes bacterium]|nr:hypothetical protein [Bacillota bacterium]